MKLKNNSWRIDLITLIGLLTIGTFGVYKEVKEIKSTIGTTAAPTPQPLSEIPTLKEVLDNRLVFGKKTTTRTYRQVVIAQKRHDAAGGPFFIAVPTEIEPGDWPVQTKNLVAIKTDWNTYQRAAMGIVADFTGKLKICEAGAYGQLPMIESVSYKGIGTIDLGAKLGLTGYFWHNECKTCKPNKESSGVDPVYTLNVDFLNGLFLEMLKCSKN